MNNSSSLAIFTSAPLSFRRQNPKKRLRDDTSKNSSGNDDASQKGWLVITTPSFTFPNSIRPMLCRKFAEEGKSCEYGRSCRFKHRAYPRAFKKAEQAIICAWVKENSGVRFANSVPEHFRDVTAPPPSNPTNNSSPPSQTTSGANIDNNSSQYNNNSEAPSNGSSTNPTPSGRN